MFCFAKKILHKIGVTSASNIHNISKDDWTATELPEVLLTGTLRDSRMHDVQNTNTLSRQFSYGLRPNDHSQEVEFVQFISN